MILLAVSAIPPITVYKVGETGHIEPGFLGFPVLKYRAGEIVEIEDADKLHPRKLNTTQVTLKPLNGSQDIVIDTRLRYFNINDISNVEKSENQSYDGKTDLISDLVASGLSNNIIACWEVPDDYITVGVSDWVSYSAMNTGESGDGYGGYTTIVSKLKANSIVYTPYSSYAQGVVNNKARYGQSATVKVYCPASGASLTKHIYDALPETALPGTLSYTMPYRVAADVRPDGCPIFSFQYNDGGTDQLSHATEFIKGGSWRTVPVVAQGLNGSLFDKLALNNARDELNTRTAIGLIGSAATLGVTGIAGGIKAAASLPQWLATQGNGIGEQNVMNEFNKGFMSSLPGLGGIGIAGTLVSYAMSIQKLKNQEELLNARCVTAVAPIQVGNSTFMNDCDMNRFYYVFTSYSGEDMWNFDEFLTRFGYRVGKMHITNRHLYSRKKFVYIKANEDLMLISNDQSRGYYVGKQIIDKVCTQLQQGVRIWRKKPDAHDLLPDGNNIKEDLAYRPYN